MANMVKKILCVAEKPSIAKAVAHHLAGSPSRVEVKNAPRLPWLKNYEFEFNFGGSWGPCQVVMTSVAGHLISSDFDARYRSWSSCNPAELFDAPIREYVEDEKKPIEKNIETHARHANALYIWTDCDREGENIGAEIRTVARRVKASLEVKRAKFSNIERAHVVAAAKSPIELDERAAAAVSARIELDLRIGASFTRMQSMALKPLIDALHSKPISYGFVVDRYFRVKSFVSDPFWKIVVSHKRENIKVDFAWRRGHLFDRLAVVVIFERCIASGKAQITKVETKPTSKWRPLPLTTVELQKNGSRFLHMDSHSVMEAAEKLYQKGFISYPRTETDQFDRGMDLKAIVAAQVDDSHWGTFAQGLVDGGFNWPRSGSHNDMAHPPIHPVNPATGELPDTERKVYEFVVRRFLACCSDDARGALSTVELTWAGEIFTASGLAVHQRNYLDVYPYDKWTSSEQLPNFQLHEQFVPGEANMRDGKTTPPHYLTEPELIGLMDANGIGTDATMAEHIAKIRDRDYVVARPKGSTTAAPSTRGRGAARGAARGRGRGGRGGHAGGDAAPNQGVLEFIPSTLGVALIQGYDALGFELSLGKPFLRRQVSSEAAPLTQMEERMKAICAGQATRADVVQQSLAQYREVYQVAVARQAVLKDSVRKYVLGQDIGGVNG